MTWNYRVMKFTYSNGTCYFAFHEVYYDEQGNPNGYSSTACEPYGESMEELKSDMSMMLKAFHLPVLTESDFPKHQKESFNNESQD
jgi:hypothetical protein